MSGQTGTYAPEFFSARASTPTILVVDDNPEILSLLELLLTSERSYRVLQATSGRQALEVTAQEYPDLLILDHNLADGFTGIALYDQLHAREGWKNIPALMVSAALPMRELEKRSLLGIQKPFDIDDLLEHIDTLLRDGTSMPCSPACSCRGKEHLVSI